MANIILMKQEKKMQLSLKSRMIFNINSKKATEETKLLMSLRCKGVPVKVYDKSNNLINEYPAITSTAKCFGLSNRTIS
jgi:hypothetical protein